MKKRYWAFLLSIVCHFGLVLLFSVSKMSLPTLAPIEDVEFELDFEREPVVVLPDTGRSAKASSAKKNVLPQVGLVDLMPGQVLDLESGLGVESSDSAKKGSVFSVMNSMGIEDYHKTKAGILKMRCIFVETALSILASMKL